MDGTVIFLRLIRRISYPSSYNRPQNIIDPALQKNYVITGIFRAPPLSRAVARVFLFKNIYLNISQR